MVIIQRINLGLFALFGELRAVGELATARRGDLAVRRRGAVDADGREDPDVGDRVGPQDPDVTGGGTGYVAAIALAVVFSVAAVTKFRDRPRVAAEFAAMGIRGPSVVARLVPAAEVVVAGMLVGLGWPGAALALGFLGGFSVVLIRLVRAGEPVRCACFGAMASRTVSAWDVGRNGLLALLGGWGVLAVVAIPRPDEVAAVSLVIAATTAAFVTARSAHDRRPRPSSPDAVRQSG